MKTLRNWTMLVLLCLVVAACGGSQEPAPITEEAPMEIEGETEAEAAPTAVVQEAEETGEEAGEEDASSESRDSDTTEPIGDVDPNLSEAWMATWMLNTTDETSAVFSGALVNVTSVRIEEIDGKAYQCITASGIPNYETVVTQELLDSLNSRPLATEEFTLGATTLTVGETLAFGQDIGYTKFGPCSDGAEGYGYWPPGLMCPEAQAKEQCFPLEPEPSTGACETGLSSIGTWVNGVSMYNYGDGMSYNGEGAWENDAFGFEFYDLDICPGHSARGDYHHHSRPVCLVEQIGDEGSGHSPIYGFAADGYPVYGPWHDDGMLTHSCWQTRDYDDPVSATGCGAAGERSCLLVDQYDISQGTTPASAIGPSTSDTVNSMSGNSFLTTSGYYVQDYYYDASCTAQGVEYLDEHNGHDHDGLGYHYHVTVTDDGSGNLVDAFPYYVGPTFAGAMADNSIARCDTGQGAPGDGGGPSGGPSSGGEGGSGPGAGGPGGPPDLAAAAEQLGISQQELMDALGRPPSDLEAAAAQLGISVEELQNVLGMQPSGQ